jgi:alpha-tubulin suppressor-like RCC1 family protein
VSKPTQIGAFKEMKITGIYAGAYHSFIQNSKGEVYGFGLNMKGQLGTGHYENQKKPTLIHSLLPHGSKNPRSSFFLETSEYRRRSKRSRDDHSELSTITNLFEKYDLHEEEKMPSFLLVEGELIIKIACGPLHTAALSNKNRLFCCGFGEKYNLGNGKAKTIC